MTFGNFMYGFECGRIWELMDHGFSIERIPIHIANRPLIESISTKFGYSIMIEAQNEEIALLSGKKIR